jgi:inner membrane protein
MRWYSHRIIGVGTALLSGGGLAAMGLAYLGSTLPDVVEGKSPREGAFFFKYRMKKWRGTHRGSSHWFGWYILLALISFYFYPVLMWLGIGALTHLAADSCTPMGVPLYPFSKKKMMSLKLFTTGSLTEIIFTSALLIFLIFYFTHHNKNMTIF